MFKKFISAIAMMAIMALLIPVSVFANSFSVLKNNVEDDFITLGEFAYYLVRVGGPLEYDSNNCALYLEDLNIDFNHKYARYMCMLGQNGVIVPAGESKKSLVDMAINRVQAVKFIYDFFEIDFYKKLFISWNLFKDVPEEVWYAHYVNCLAAYNFFEYDDEVEFGGNFEPFKYMTKKTAYKWFKALGNLPLE